MTDRQTYMLLGAGGTGSILYPLLRAYLRAYHRNMGNEWSIFVADGDEIEPHNLDRQLFEGRYVMGNKAEALLEQYPTEQATPVAKYLGEEDIRKGIRDGDIVLIAVDNFPVRSHIENHAKTLDNAVVINGGNEMYHGTTQIWVRKDGQDITPPLSEGHPEIHRPGDDRAEMSCQAIAELPGGEQTIVANAASAGWMLRALTAVHSFRDVATPIPFHTLYWDTRLGTTRAEGAPNLMELIS